MKNLQLTAVFVEAEEGGYVGYLDEMREVITQGETIQEVEENLFDALQMYLEPDPMNIEKRQLTSITKKPFISLHSLL